MLEILKVIILGIVEGITEWLPISSTGHMILIDEFIKFSASEEFKEMFFVLIQLGAIFAVIYLYWEKVYPIKKKVYHKKISANENLPDKKVVYYLDGKKTMLIAKILVACIPAGIIGILFDDYLHQKFYNFVVVAIMLIVYGIAFIVAENFFADREPRVNSLDEITFKDALFIGVFQVLSLIPGTSRSGATILGGIISNVSRKTSAEFTFLLAVPVMLGASLLKLIKFGLGFSFIELFYLLLGMAVAYVVSLYAIRFLLSYVRNKDFKIFGYYRIVLGIILLIYNYFLNRG